MAPFRGIFVVLCVLAAMFLSAGQASKILVVFPVPSHSHFTLGLTLSKALAERGHQVSFMNAYPEKCDFKNIKSVSTEPLVSILEEEKKKLFMIEQRSALANLFHVFDMFASLADVTLQCPDVHTLLKSRTRFDVVIVEHFMNEALAGLAHAFGGHLILMAPIGSSAVNNHFFSNPAPSSYVPNMVLPLTKHMTFFQRLKNLGMNLATGLLTEFYVMPKHRAIFEKHISRDVSLDTVLSNATLMLTNSHVSVTDAKPHVPNIVEIGGFHVAQPQALPQDIKKFLDGATEGAVLFSMGSNLKSKDLKAEVLTDILRSFGKIKQKVLWKFEADIQNLPSNVKIMKWLPQNDVLAHPNIRAFISHGGLLSTIETIYHGVPIIGIPVFGDQKSNIARAALSGFAVSLPLQELTEGKLSAALNTILNNPKYSETVKQRSKAMRDRPMQPLDTAVYWIEYVIRHQGAPLLRNGGMDLAWYQRHMVDIAIFLTLVTIAIFVIFYIIIKWILGFCGKSKKEEVNRKTGDKKKRN